MGLVRSIAFRYRNLGVPEEDLVQEGAIGLLTAVNGLRTCPRRDKLLHVHFQHIRAGSVTHAVTTSRAAWCRSRALCSSAGGRSDPPPATC